MNGEVIPVAPLPVEEEQKAEAGIVTIHNQLLVARTVQA